MPTRTERRGRIQTVDGLIEPQALGPTLMHEHILWDVSRPEVVAKGEPEVVINLRTVWEINRRSTKDYGNQHMRDRAVAIDEVRLFREQGGGAIVDLSNYGLAPDPEGLRAVSRATGVPIVMGGGYYVDEYIPEERKDRSVNQLTAEMIGQIEDGAFGTDVRCGLLGELGCMWPLRPFERKVLTAAGHAQQSTGAAISIHPGRHAEAPFEILDVLEAAGADPARVVMGHIDRTLFTTEEALRLADRGCVIEYDFFGIETSYWWFGPGDLPTDYMRLRHIRALIDRGHKDRIVVSHDICTKTRLNTWGGHGYGHIVRNVVPLMREKGFTQSEIDAILIDNPRRLLAFV